MEHGLYSHRRYGNVQLPLIDKDNLGKQELIYDLPMEDYHSDRAHISSTGVKKLLKSPEHFMCWLAGVDQEEEEEKDHFRFGRAAHMAILEPKKFEEVYIVEPVHEGLTQDGKMSTQSKAAKEAKQKWRDALPPGSMVITELEMVTLTGMIESLMAHPQASQMFMDGRPEVTGLWTHEETGIRCRIRPDYLTDKDGNLYILDLKTTRDMSKGLFSNDIARLRYHLSLAFYYDGIKKITGRQPAAAAFVVSEKTPPYSCGVYWAPDDMLDQGRQWYGYALKVLKRCMDTGEWPGPQGEGELINLPRWTENEVFPQFSWKE